MPAGEQAFRDALALKDPDAKLRAFQQLLADFPDSPTVKNGAVHFNIVSLATGKAGTAAKEAREAAAAFAALIPNDRDRASWQNLLLARRFADTNAMWSEAEHYARKALDWWDAGDPKHAPQFAGAPLERAVLLAVLGEAICKQGRDEEAQRYLRQAYDARSTEPAVVAKVVPLLLDIAKRRDRSDEQLEYLTALALYGALTPALRADLEGVFRQTHSGSINGLESMLDERYEADMPKAVPVERFNRPAVASRRTVLAEMFTGVSCSPCVGMDLAFEAVVRRYEPKDLVLLVYHVHSPAPDPLVNPSGEARAQLYGFRGAPHWAIDGVEPDQEGGANATAAASIFHDRVEPAIQRAIQLPTPVRLSVQPSRLGHTIRVRVAADRIPRDKSVRLQVALVEKRVRYSGGNGIRFHAMVVRKMAGDGLGIAVPATGAFKTEVVFDVLNVRNDLKSYLDNFEKKGDAYFPPSTFDEKKHDMDESQLLVVAFVQEDGTHRVLQAAVSETSGT